MLSVIGVGSAVASSLAQVGSVVSDPPPGGDGDGALEPGESAGFTQRLFNPNPDTATNTTGTLTSDSFGVTVSPAQASWPAMSVGAIAANSQPFGLTLANNVACGEPIDLGLALSVYGYPESLSLKLRAGLGPETDSSDPALPRIIATQAGFDSRLTLSGAGVVKNMRVRIPWLDHSFVGDIAMTLRSPAGTTITLMNSPGKGSFGSARLGFSDLVLSDDADTPIEELPSSMGGRLPDAYRPDDPLSRFDGESKAGMWTLHVSDTFPAADIGFLHSWGIAPVGVNCSTAANDPPLARPDAYTAIGAGATLQGASVLANDTDDENDALTAEQLSGPAHGSLSLAPDGSFSYTPLADYAGPDSFSYQARDASAGSAAMTVKISVKGPNYPPPVFDIGYYITSGQVIRGDVLDLYSDPNGDPLVVTLTGGGTRIGELDLQPDGSFMYAAPQVDSPLVGNDFEYTVSDGHSAPVLERVYFGVDNFGGGALPAATLTGSPKAVKSKPPAETRAFANVQIKRAAISGRRLKVRASISRFASGRVKASYRSGGQVTKTRVRIASGVVSFALALSARQRRDPAGSLKLTYAGNARTLPETATLKPMGHAPRLRIKDAHADATGTLHVAGTIARRARGLVRMRLRFSPRAGRLKTYDYQAKIRRGKWAFTDVLPADALARAQITISYSGDNKHHIAGAHMSQDITG